MQNVPRSIRYYDWYLTATVNAGEFARSGSIYFFLCDEVPPMPPSGGWNGVLEVVGSVAVFKDGSGEAGNVSGRVPLTSALLKKGKDLSDEKTVEEYLKTHLHWRCALVDGKEVPLEDVPSLEVKVFSRLTERQFLKDGSETFPKVHAPVLHPSVTSGKRGGYTGESG